MSGAHINPAVTVGFWLAGRFDGRYVLPYVLAQGAGALFASGLLRLLFADAETLGGTYPSGTPLQSLVLEGVLTWLLVFVILCVAIGAKEKGLMAGIAIGGTVGLEALFAGPISGARRAGRHRTVGLRHRAARRCRRGCIRLSRGV